MRRLQTGWERFYYAALAILVVVACGEPLQGRDIDARRQAAGFAKDDNFTVLTSDVSGPDGAVTRESAHAYAKSILEEASIARTYMNRQWFDTEIPDGQGRTIINVNIDPFADKPSDAGLTWAKDDPRRKYHTIFLGGKTPESIFDSLNHEVIHAVLAEKYPHPQRLAAWLEESIASMADDTQRKNERAALIRNMAQTGQFPSLNEMLSAKNIPAERSDQYAMSRLTTEYLLSVDSDRQKLLDFGRDAQDRGWEAALNKHYPSVGGLDALEQKVQAYAPKYLKERPEGGAPTVAKSAATLAEPPATLEEPPATLETTSDSTESEDVVAKYSPRKSEALKTETDAVFHGDKVVPLPAEALAVGGY